MNATELGQRNRQAVEPTGRFPNFKGPAPNLGERQRAYDLEVGEGERVKRPARGRWGQALSGQTPSCSTFPIVKAVHFSPIKGDSPDVARE